MPEKKLIIILFFNAKPVYWWQILYSIQFKSSDWMYQASICMFSLHQCYTGQSIWVLSRIYRRLHQGLGLNLVLNSQKIKDVCFDFGYMKWYSTICFTCVSCGHNNCVDRQRQRLWLLLKTGQVDDLTDVKIFLCVARFIYTVHIRVIFHKRIQW